MRKIIVCSVITLAFLGLCGIVVVNAQASGNGTYPSIVQKLADKFGLNVDEVKAVFDEFRKEERQTKQDFQEARNGESNLTDEQKQALSAKREEMRTQTEALKDLSADERKAKMDELKTEFEGWAKENGIAEEGHFFQGMFGGHGGHRGPRMGEPNDNSLDQ